MRALRLAILPTAIWLLTAIGLPEAARAAGEVGAQRAKEAATALQRNQIERAVQLLTEALADPGVPNDRRAALYNDRGVAYGRLNQTRAAIDDFNRSVQLFPESPSVYNNRGTLLLALGLAQEATKDFDRALLLAPGYAAAYSNRANALARLGDSEGGLRDFGQAARLAPQSPAPLNGRGRLHLAQNRPHAALRDFSRAIAKDAKFSAGYKARAEAKIALERFEDAVEDLSRAIAFEPQNIDIYVLRGYCYLAARNTSSAIKDFQRATEIDPKSTLALEALALAHAKAEAHDDAINHLARAIELDARSAQAYAYRAVVYKWMGQPELGDKDVDRAVKLDPARPEVLWARGELAEAAGSKEDAIADLKKAATLRPLLRDAFAALDRLGAPIVDEANVRELAFERWNVVVSNNRYYAINPEMPRLSVPLEMMSEGTPRILAWDLKSSGIKGIGILRFLAGRIDTKEGPEEAEHAAVIDTQARAVLALEPVRQGQRKATWSWEEDRLVVTGIDGFKEEYLIRVQRPRDVAQPPVARDQRRITSAEPGSPKANGPPSWAPWAQPSGGDNRPRQQRQQQPKTLFDLLFKN
ncbi:MAG: tetratricopeptide repeat protein [Hyphomicrobiaceae bacterium]